MNCVSTFTVPALMLLFRSGPRTVSAVPVSALAPRALAEWTHLSAAGAVLGEMATAVIRVTTS